MDIHYTCVCYVPNNPAFQSDAFLNKFTINVFKNGNINAIYSYYDNINQYNYSVFEINDNLPFSDYYLEKLKQILLSLNIKDNSDFSISSYTENLYFICKIFKDINQEYDNPSIIEYNHLLYKNQKLYSENRKLKNSLNYIDKRLELESNHSKLSLNDIDNDHNNDNNDNNQIKTIKDDEDSEDKKNDIQIMKLNEEIDNFKKMIISKDNEIKYFKLETEKHILSLKNKDEIIDKINIIYNKSIDANVEDQLNEAHFHLNKYLSDLLILKKELEDEKKKVLLLESSLDEKDDELSDKSRIYDKLNENHKKLLIINKNRISEISEYKELLFSKNLEIDSSSKKYNDIFTTLIISTILFSIIISINYFIY
jgi:chromosome segregation ATPase